MPSILRAFSTEKNSLHQKALRHLSSLTVLVAFFAMCFGSPSSAMYDRDNLVEIPIERLLTNLFYAEKKCDSNKCKADIKYRLARLYSMRYARGIKTAEVHQHDKDSTDVIEPAVRNYDIVRWPDYRQYKVDPDQLSSESKKDLGKAVACNIDSLTLDPENVKALLGLGWCLKERGNNADSISALRKTISLTTKIDQRNGLEHDNKQTGQGFYDNRRIAQEAAFYLIPLLDSQKDGDELKELTMLGPPDYEPHFVTPIVVATSPQVALSSMMKKCKVTFDIEGFGPQKLNEWPAPKSGWLVWDPYRSNKISSGVQLIGSSSFWIPWDNGYEVLSALDNNHDGQLTGSELRGLALWIDLNCNGTAESGEVQSLIHYKIQGISCKFIQNGRTFANTRGVKFVSGRTAPTCDWIYKTEFIKQEQIAEQ